MDEGDKAPRPIPLAGSVALGAYFVLLAAMLVAALIGLWPAIENVSSGEVTTAQDVSLLWGALEFSVSPDTTYIILVVIVSAIGSYVHAATSFVTYLGNRELATSWIWWYLLRVFVGIALALLFYFAVRGGFFAQGAGAADVNPYGIAALAGLAGLFSKQATDKLKEVFDVVFRVERGGDAERGDKISE